MPTSADEATDTASEDFVVKDYTLKYTGNESCRRTTRTISCTVHFDAYKDSQFVGSVDPTVQFVQSTQQQKLVASVISFRPRTCSWCIAA